MGSSVATNAYERQRKRQSYRLLGEIRVYTELYRSREKRVKRTVRVDLDRGQALRERDTARSRGQMLPCARKSGGTIGIVGTPVGWMRRMRVTQTTVRPMVEDDARSASRVTIDHLGGNH